MSKLIYFEQKYVKPELLEGIEKMIKENPEHEIILSEVLSLVKGHIPIPNKKWLKIMFIELAMTGLFDKNFISRGLMIAEMM